MAFRFDSEEGHPERWKEWDTCDNPRGRLILRFLSRIFHGGVCGVCVCVVCSRVFSRWFYFNSLMNLIELTC